MFPKFDGHPVPLTFSRMLWDCRHHGWTGYVISGKRSRAEQQRLYDGWVKHLPGFNPAFPPDKSAHCRSGWHCAVDVTDPGSLLIVAKSRGWDIHRPYPKELWHIEFTRKPRRTWIKKGPH